MKTSTLSRSTKPMKRSPLRTKPDAAKLTVKPMKSRGMKGRAPTKAERELHHAIAGIGCVACLLDDRVNPWVVIHHIDGRTKENAHREVLPLCAQHHQQDDTDALGRIAVHPNKARFEERYGSQYELLANVMARIAK